MIKKEKCEICQEAEQKYRCPTCRIVYCSVTCYKEHKDNCSSLPEDEVISKEAAGGQEESKPVPDFNLKDDDSEDRVAQEKLEELARCKTLKDKLTNPHLRQIMMSLVHAKDPTQLLESSMQEPIFTEFVDTCLSVIDGEGAEEVDKWG